jgi:hypothetical protein
MTYPSRLAPGASRVSVPKPARGIPGRFLSCVSSRMGVGLGTDYPGGNP